MVLTVRQVLLPEKMDFPGTCCKRSRDSTPVVNLSDLLLVLCQECKEGLVHKIFDKSAPDSTLSNALDISMQVSWCGKVQEVFEMRCNQNRSLNPFLFQEENFHLTHEQFAKDHPTAEPVFSLCSNCNDYLTVLKLKNQPILICMLIDMPREDIQGASL